MLENSIDHVRDEILDGVQELFEVEERQLGLDVRVLGQVTTSARRLGSIRLGNAEHVAESRTRGLQIQLRRLGQISLEGEIFILISIVKS